MPEFKNIYERVLAYKPAVSGRGDHSLNPEALPLPPYRPAAVLVPIIRYKTGPAVLFTQRTDHLHDHAGQVSFPGGGMDEGDGSPVHTALREAEEEIGLRPDQVEIIGRLDTYITRTGFEVTPVVGLVTPPLVLAPDPFEVASIFEVPLDHARQHLKLDAGEFRGKIYEFYALQYETWYIWGATAGMLKNLLDVTAGEAM